MSSTVIEFVGLCLFTTQVVGINNNFAARTAFRIGDAVSTKTVQVVAIMPRVGGKRHVWDHAVDLSHAADFSRAVIDFSPITDPPSPPPNPAMAKPVQRQALAAQPATPPTPLSTVGAGSSAVETHTAMLVYRPEERISVIGWQEKPLRLGYSYVELSGDKITFESDDTNPAIQPVNTLAIPRMASGKGFKVPYQPPYPAAVAVFTIGNGKLSTCQKTAFGHTPRIDTKLSMNAKKSVTIRSGANSLTLKAGAYAVAANVPFPYAASNTSTPNAAMHYVVYCDMIDSPVCKMPFPEKNDTDCTEAPFLPPPPGGGSGTPQALATSGSGSMLELFSVDFACSNTQWP